uniref:Transthyretin-like family protein n=2 Tax=Wuchereria bancrofti TaxID=6293 RepID=A0AAF5Q2S4_WUCBA
MQILIIFTALLTCYTFAFLQQTIAIRGQLMCGAKPLNDVRIEVWNKNRLGTDYQLIDTRTNNAGYFEAIGRRIGAFFHIKPYMRVYHTCDHDTNIFGMQFKKPGSRTVKWIIPSRFVDRSGNVGEFFDIGIINMQIIFPKEMTK